jgi:tripartite-type tricarboxylate transporter receptor subunit TctC
VWTATGHAKANPGKIDCGSSGAGTALHIGLEQIANREDIKWTHVPFKGGPDAITRRPSRSCTTPSRWECKTRLFAATLAKFDQEIFYLNSEDYQSYAMKQIAEEQRVVEELGLKG